MAFPDFAPRPPGGPEREPARERAGGGRQVLREGTLPVRKRGKDSPPVRRFTKEKRPTIAGWPLVLGGGGGN